MCLTRGVLTRVDSLAIYGIDASVNQIRGRFAADERMSVQRTDFWRDEVATLGKNVARTASLDGYVWNCYIKSPPSTDLS